MEDIPVDNEQAQETWPEAGFAQNEPIQPNFSAAQPLSPDFPAASTNEQPTVPAPPEAEQNHDAEILLGIRQLTGEMRDLREDFETKVKYDESKERLLNTLHKELQNYREGFHFKILRPTLMDLISMYDDLEKILEDYERRENSLSPEMRRNLYSFQQSIEETLRRNEVEPFQVEGETLVAGKQRILKVVGTDNPGQDRYIARRVRKGFEYAGQIVLRPELVELYRFNPNLHMKEAEK